MLSFTMPGEARSNQWKYEVSPVNVNWSRGDEPLVPLAVVTVTSVVLTVCAGLIAVTVVSFTTLKLAAAVAPKATAVRPLLKPLPVAVTEVPPVGGQRVRAGDGVDVAADLDEQGKSAVSGACHLRIGGLISAVGRQRLGGSVAWEERRRRVHT